MVVKEKGVRRKEKAWERKRAVAKLILFPTLQGNKKRDVMIC